jgi:hypothetical protein
LEGDILTYKNRCANAEKQIIEAKEKEAIVVKKVD